MASRQEDLRITYPPPNVFGSHFNERPQPDALGRRIATPREVQQAIYGTFNPPPQPFEAEWKRLKLEREQRKAAARVAKNNRNHGNENSIR